MADQVNHKPEEKLHQDAIRLLEDINEVLGNHTGRDSINIKMAGVIRDLNNIRIEKITGIKDLQDIEKK